MNNSTVRHCATPSPARSGSWCPRWIPRGPPSKNIGNPCVSEGAPLEFHWRHQCSGCRPYQYHQNVINRPKPFKTPVKMDDSGSTVWSPPTATQRRSGSRHACSERELRAKCVTWKSLKNHREMLLFQCAPWVHQFCHDDVLCSKGQHVCMCGVHDSASELIPKLIKTRVIWNL